MATARAVTNAIGHISLVEGHDCHTEAFRVDTRPSPGLFPDESGLIKSQAFLYDQDSEGLVPLGRLLGSLHFPDLDLIARELSEMGALLHEGVQVMESRPVAGQPRGMPYEVWTQSNRYMVVKKRVYGHKRHYYKRQY